MSGHLSFPMPDDGNMFEENSRQWTMSECLPSKRDLVLLTLPYCIFVQVLLTLKQQTVVHVP